MLAEVDPGNTITESNETNNLDSEFVSAKGTDVVLDWNATLLNAVATDKTAPPLAARNTAMVHVAIYDAVNAIDQTHNDYFVDAVAPERVSPRSSGSGGCSPHFGQFVPTPNRYI